MQYRSVVAGAVALAFLAASPSAAEVYTVRGVASITDVTGEIGSPGAQLTRDFTLVFTRNDALGAFQNDGVYSLLGGYGADNPVTATLAIGSFTYDFGSNYGEQYQTKANAGGEGFEFYASNTYACAPNFCDLDSSFVSINVTHGSGAYLPDHLIYSLPSLTKADTPAFLWQGSFNIERLVIQDGMQDYQSVRGQFDISSITVGVPEPGSWAVMVLGFAGVGHRVRRRKRRIGPTAAASLPA
jgi:hypothetical protein